MKNIKLFEEFTKSAKKVEPNDNTKILIGEITSLIKRYYNELLSNGSKYPTAAQLSMLSGAKESDLIIMKRKWTDKVHEIEETHKHDHSPESI